MDSFASSCYLTGFPRSFSSPFFSEAQGLHTSATGALIDLPEQSKIELETGYGSSFYTLSGDPREKKGGQVYTK